MTIFGSNPLKIHLNECWKLTELRKMENQAPKAYTINRRISNWEKAITTVLFSTAQGTTLCNNSFAFFGCEKILLPSTAQSHYHNLKIAKWSPLILTHIV